MSFPIDTPIGLLPYAITPTGEVQFLLWKASNTTPEHSSTLYGDCNGVKTKYDQSMWDVCARTWAEQTGGLFAISEEFRLKREKKEKKAIKALNVDPNIAAVKNKKSDKNDKDKKDKRNKSDKNADKNADKKNETRLSLNSPSILSYETNSAIHNIDIETITPNELNGSSEISTIVYSQESKKFKHFQLIYKTYSAAQLVFNSTKLVRKLLTSRQTNVITLTNDNTMRPRFLYCIEIEYMPLWMINYVVKNNGNGECRWVHSYELIKYVSLQLISNISGNYIEKVLEENNIDKIKFLPQNDSELKNELDNFVLTFEQIDRKAQLTAQIEHEGIIYNNQDWELLSREYYAPPIETVMVTPSGSDLHGGAENDVENDVKNDEKKKITKVSTKTKILLKSGSKLGNSIQFTPKTAPIISTPQDNNIPKKLTIPSPHTCSYLINNANNNNQDAIVLTKQFIPLNLQFLSVLTVESLSKLVKLCKNALNTTRSSPLYPSDDKLGIFIKHVKEYDLPQYLIQYNDDLLNEYYNNTTTSTTQSGPNSNNTFIMTPSQRQQLALDIQQSNGYYKCRQCRHVLFASCHLITHDRFDFDQHVEKAHRKYLQQSKSSLQSYRKAITDAKFVLGKCEKQIRKYILNRRIQAEIASYDDGFDDEDDDDEGFDDDEDDDNDGQIEVIQIDDDDNDDNDDNDDMFATAQRNRAMLFGPSRKSNIDSDDDDDDDDHDYNDDNNNDKNKGLILDLKLYDSGILLTYTECYDSIRLYSQHNNGIYDIDENTNNNGVIIEDEYEFNLREEYIEQFYEYQNALKCYHDEKLRLDNGEAGNYDVIDMYPGDNNNNNNSNEQRNSLEQTQTALNNFSEEKGTGVYVKPVFGKSSFKGFTNNNENICQSIFLNGDNNTFPPTLIPMNSTEGGIICRNCNYRFGNYNWSGTQCSCGQWVIPGLQIPISKIDFTFRERYQTHNGPNNNHDNNHDNNDNIIQPSQQHPHHNHQHSQQHFAGPQPNVSTASSATAGPLGNKIIGVRRLPVTRPPVKKPGTQ